MIVKVMNSAPSARSPLMYNEFKVHQGLAEICAVENIGSTGFPDIWEAIVGREKNNRRTEKPSLHITFNPGVDDNMTPEEMLKFIPEWMKMVGLGNQPYAIYYHHDIVRGHYHVVSTKLRECGTSVRTNNLRYKNVDALEQLANEYSFFIGSDPASQKAMSREERHRVLEQKGFDPFKFDASKSNVWDQIDLIYTSVIRDFTYRSDAEFRTIMEVCGLDASISPSKYDGHHVVVHYRDEKGKKTGRPRTYGNEDYEMMHNQIKENHKPSTARVEKAIRDALVNAQNVKDFEKALNDKEVVPRQFLNKLGTYQGVTFVDFHDFQVIKASELRDINKTIRAVYTAGLDEARRLLKEQDDKEKEASGKIAAKQDYPVIMDEKGVRSIKRRGPGSAPDYLTRKLPGREIVFYPYGAILVTGEIFSYATIDGEDFTVKYDPKTKQCQFAEGFVNRFEYRRVMYRDYPEGDYMTKRETRQLAATRIGNLVVNRALQRVFPQSEIILHEAQTTTREAGVLTVAFATIDGKKKTILLEGYNLTPFAISDGFVRRDLAHKYTRENLTSPVSGRSGSQSIFRLIQALSALGGAHHQAASSNVGKKGTDDWEESHRAAEEEDMERKKSRGITQ